MSGASCLRAPASSTLSQRPALHVRKWTTKDIRDLRERKMGKRARWAQLKIASAVYEGKDVTGVAPTGFGKTFAFFLPLFMGLEDEKDCMTTVIAPLNLLARQNAILLNENGLSAFAISSDTASPSVFEVYFAVLNLHAPYVIYLIGNPARQILCRRNQSGACQRETFPKVIRVTRIPGAPALRGHR